MTRAPLLAALASVFLMAAMPGQAAVPADWSGYLYDASHGSTNAAATSITPANTGSLTKYWQWHAPNGTQSGQPGPGLFASPTVVGGRVYIGANTGVFYALDLATKTVVWSRFLGFVTHKTCGPRGIISTATVVPDPTRGGQLTVYVAGADGYLYALDASDGTVVWQSEVAIPSTVKNDYFNWGSPAVNNGTVYMGISSQCDAPLVRAGIKGYDQGSGTLIGTYFSVPDGSLGASFWSSLAVDPATGDVFGSTGNGKTGDAASVVRVDGTTIAREDAWAVPVNQRNGDSDFGASPTLFTATLDGTPVPMVGACNKNGRYYALRQQDLSAGPVWQFVVAKSDPEGQHACLTAAIWDGSRLFVAGTTTTIGGRQFPGSVRRLDPATGAVIWARGLNGAILGSPTLDGAGVMALGTYNLGAANFVYLVNSANGQLLRTIAVGKSHLVFGQPVFADNYLLIPAGSGGLIVYAV
jgi:outer membrane protein assembly factor BamB